MSERSNWTGEMLTATRVLDGQRAASMQAWRKTHWPMPEISPGFLRHGNEAAGHDHAVDRVVPSHQRPRSRPHAARAELHQGLVIDFEFLPDQRLAQIHFHGAPAPDDLLHAGIEHLVAAATLALDSVEGDVRAAQEIVEVFAALGGEGHTDARADPELIAFDFIDPAQPGGDEVGHADGVATLLAGDADEGEFVAAQAHDVIVRAGAGGQMPGNLQQEGVADHMTAGVRSHI